MLPFYYGTKEQLSSKESYALKKYRKRTAFTTYGNFLLDPALFTLVNLDCNHCRKVHPSTCCEDGQPYSMTDDAESLLMSHAKQIVQSYHTVKRNHEFSESGFLEISERTNGVRSIKKCDDGNCFFYVSNEQEGYCSIHRYAEQQQIDYMNIKPFSCSLFPLDIIQDDHFILLTALTEETMSFSRWGSEYANYLCINLSLRKTVKIDQPYFSLQGYKPAWQWGQELLAKAFGEDLIEAIIRLQPKE